MNKLNWSKSFAIFFFLFLASSSSFAKLNVVATTSDLASIAQLIGGDKVSVVSLNPGTRDPHFAEAKPSMIRQVANADMLLVIGADLEVGWLPPLLQSARNTKVNPGGNGYVDVSTVIDLLGKTSGQVDRSRGDVHANGNPHYWLNPANGEKIGMLIRDKYKELDSANAANYDRQFTQFSDKLRSEMETWKNELGFLAGKKVIAYHTSFAYLAQAYGFEIVDDIEPIPGIAPNAAHIQQLVNRIKQNQVEMIIMEPYYERKSASFLREKTGVAVAIVPQSVGARADATDYLHLFDVIVHALKHPGDI